MKHKGLGTNTEKLAEEIAGLSSLQDRDLRARWRSLYGTEPPARISRDLLVRAVAHRMQEKAFGGLKPSTRRLLAKVADDASARRPIRVTPKRSIKPGTVLLREWHGVRHQVTVLEQSVAFEDKCYRSLSEVARKITGTRWSGPLFFGLKASREEGTDGTH